MTDEKFEQILKQALTPQNSDSELKINKRVRTYDMKKIMKRVIAIAACVVLTLSSSYALDYLNIEKQNNVQKQNGELVTSHKNESNTFKIMAYAAEITRDNAIPIKMNNDAYGGSYMGADEAKGIMYYCINLPLLCEGENIRNITYSINKGSFQIVEPADSTYLIDYVEYVSSDIDHVGGDINFGMVGGSDDGELDASSSPKEKVLYLDSFTLDYDKQTGSDFWINIGNVVPNMKEAIDLKWNSDDSPENHQKAENMLLSDVQIRVTITFEDGTQSTKMIGLESIIIDLEGNRGKMTVIALKEL